VSLDTQLAATNAELVLSHLRARRASPELLASMSTIGSLRSSRNACIVAGDAARGERKALSQEIGILMRGAGKKGAAPGGGGGGGSSKGEEEAAAAAADAVGAIKAAVEVASARATAADEEQATVDTQLHALFALLPNLLDDCVPDGADQDSNVLVEVELPLPRHARHRFHPRQ
jgi:seryl-tRNA synthetase